jgi:long-subunit acyl-CoA synthetase (AMP-forming)
VSCCATLQGVLIKHSAMVACVAGQKVYLEQIAPNVDGESLTEADVMLSYLPLAHIFDRWAASPRVSGPLDLRARLNGDSWQAE